MKKVWLLSLLLVFALMLSHVAFAAETDTTKLKMFVEALQETYKEDGDDTFVSFDEEANALLYVHTVPHLISEFELIYSVYPEERANLLEMGKQLDSILQKILLESDAIELTTITTIKTRDNVPVAIYINGQDCTDAMGF